MRFASVFFQVEFLGTKSQHDPNDHLFSAGFDVWLISTSPRSPVSSNQRNFQTWSFSPKKYSPIQVIIQMKCVSSIIHAFFHEKSLHPKSSQKICNPPETNSSHLKIGRAPKGNDIFQPTFFKGHGRFREGESFLGEAKIH